METIRGKNYLLIILLIVYFTLVESQEMILDCNGRSSICVGPLNYKTCIDNGYGIMVTDNKPVQICPVGTRCLNEGEKSCAPLQVSHVDENEEKKPEDNGVIVSATEKTTSSKVVRDISKASVTTISHAETPGTPASKLDNLSSTTEGFENEQSVNELATTEAFLKIETETQQTTDNKISTEQSVDESSTIVLGTTDVGNEITTTAVIPNVTDNENEIRTEKITLEAETTTIKSSLVSSPKVIQSQPTVAEIVSTNQTEFPTSIGDLSATENSVVLTTILDVKSSTEIPIISTVGVELVTENVNLVTTDANSVFNEGALSQTASTNTESADEYLSTLTTELSKPTSQLPVSENSVQDQEGSVFGTNKPMQEINTISHNLVPESSDSTTAFVEQSSVVTEQPEIVSISNVPSNEPSVSDVENEPAGTVAGTAQTSLPTQSIVESNQTSTEKNEASSLSLVAPTEVAQVAENENTQIDNQNEQNTSNLPVDTSNGQPLSETVAVYPQEQPEKSGILPVKESQNGITPTEVQTINVSDLNKPETQANPSMVIPPIQNVSVDYQKTEIPEVSSINNINTPDLSKPEAPISLVTNPPIQNASVDYQQFTTKNPELLVNELDRVSAITVSSQATEGKLPGSKPVQEHSAILPQEAQVNQEKGSQHELGEKGQTIGETLIPAIISTSGTAFKPVTSKNVAIPVAVELPKETNRTHIESSVPTVEKVSSSLSGTFEDKNKFPTSSLSSDTTSEETIVHLGPVAEKLPNLPVNGIRHQTKLPVSLSSETSEETVENLVPVGGKQPNSLVNGIRNQTKLPVSLSSETSEETVEHLVPVGGKQPNSIVNAFRDQTKLPVRISSETSEETVENLVPAGEKQPNSLVNGFRDQTKLSVKISSETSEETVENLVPVGGKQPNRFQIRTKRPDILSSETSEETIEIGKEVKKMNGKNSHKQMNEESNESLTSNTSEQDDDNIADKKSLKSKSSKSSTSSLSSSSLSSSIEHKKAIKVSRFHKSKHSLSSSKSSSNDSSKSNESLDSGSNEHKKHHHSKSKKSKENLATKFANKKYRKDKLKFKCSEEGIFSDSLDCRKYYKCVKKDSSESDEKIKFKKYTLKCSDYQVFDVKLSKCIYSAEVRCVVVRA